MLRNRPVDCVAKGQAYEWRPFGSLSRALHREPSRTQRYSAADAARVAGYGGLRPPACRPRASRDLRSTVYVAANGDGLFQAYRWGAAWASRQRQTGTKSGRVCKTRPLAIVKLKPYLYEKAAKILGNSSTVEHRTLTPRIKVRILVPQPIDFTKLSSISS